MKRTMQRLAVTAMLLGTLFLTGVSAAGTNTVPPTTVPKDLLAAAIENDGVLRVLAIGNSYSVDGLWYLNEVFQAENPGYDVEIGNMYIGSCSLSMHADRIDGDPADYTYYRYDSATGKWKTETKKTLDYGLNKADWDFISLQQNSGNSGKPETYNEDLTAVAEYVQEKVPGAKLLWHMTWPWSDQYSKIGPSGSYASQAAMHQAICNAVQEKISADTFVAVIPSGTTVENIGDSHYGYDALHRDDVHLSDVARVGAAYTWYATLTGNVVDTDSFPELTNSKEETVVVDKPVIANSVNNAIAVPFEVRNPEHSAQDGHDECTALTTDAATLSGGDYYLAADVTAVNPITVTGEVTLCLNGKTLNACAASSGSFITVADGGALTIYDCGGGKISGAKAGTATRGIEVQSGGSLLLKSGSIVGFTTTGDGGGVLVKEGGTFVMSRGKVLGNTAANGGGICNNNGKLTIGGGSVAENRATGNYGGGVYTMGSANITSITGGSISGNYCAAQGGGVAIRGKGATITGGTFGGTKITGEAELAEGTGNYAKTNGGGMYIGIQTTVGGNADVRGNYSAKSDGGGGGIRAGGSIIIAGNAQIRENGAAYNGGGIYAPYSLTIKDNASIASNTAVNFGGGVYVGSSRDNDTLKLQGGTIKSNTVSSSSNGSGIYVNGTTQLLMTGGTLSGTKNLLYVKGSKTGKVSGGVIDGIVVVGSNTTATATQLELAEGTTVTGNVDNYGMMLISGGTYGGRVRSSGGVAGRNLTISGGIFDGEVTMHTSDSYNDGSLIITGGTFNGTVNRPDGVIGELSISGGQFSAATAKESLEGWLAEGKYLHSVMGYYQVADTEQVLAPCTEDHTGWTAITGPAALDVEGGKYYLTADILGVVSSSSKYGIDVTADNVTLCMHGFSVIPAESDSGALRANGENFTLQNGSTDGGYLRGKSVKSVLVNKLGMVMKDNVHISGATITGGDSIGAAVQINGTSGYVGSFTMEGGTISDNVVTTPTGHKQEKSAYGTIVINGTDATVTLKGGEISGNVINYNTAAAAAYVGGACSNSGKLIISGDVLIDGNSVNSTFSSTFTNGIYNRGTVTMTGGTISNHINGTKTGGGVYNTGTFTMSGGSIIGNATSTNGGGVYNTKTFVMTGGTISGNVGLRGDQLYSYNDCTATISGGSIIDWENNDSEGIFASSKGDITITGDACIDSKIFANSSSGNTGKIAISGGKFGDKMDRNLLGSWVVAPEGDTTSTLAIVDNDNAAEVAEGYVYKVGTGLYSLDYCVNFDSTLNLDLIVGTTNLNDSNFYPFEQKSLYSVEAVSAEKEYDASIGYCMTGQNEGYYAIFVSGIAAKEMHNEILVTVIEHETENKVFEKTVSVFEVAKEWKADPVGETDEEKAAYVAMLDDMINYGIEAEKVFLGEAKGAALGEGTSAEVAPQWQGTTGAGVMVSKNGYDYSDKVAVTLNLKSKIELNIYVNDANAHAAQMKLNVDWDAGDDTSFFFTTGKAKDKEGNDLPVLRVTMDKHGMLGVEGAQAEITIGLKDEQGEDDTFVVKFGIADYVIASLADEDETQDALLIALQRYLDSASAWFAAKNG